MRIDELPANWMEPGSDGFALLAGVGCQILILIPCSRCGHTGAQDGAPCVDCRDSPVPGYHAMRAPLGQLLDALLAERLKPGGLVAPTAVQRTLRGALDHRQTRTVLRGNCPDCGSSLEYAREWIELGEMLHCSGGCGAAFGIFQLEDGIEFVIRVDLDARNAAALGEEKK